MNVENTALSDETSQHRTRTPAPPHPGTLDVEQAEAALVEHYPRLVRLAYLVLPSSSPRHRRALAAHSLVQRALPRGRGAAGVGGQLPAQRRSNGDGEDLAPPGPSGRHGRASGPGTDGRGPGRTSGAAHQADRAASAADTYLCLVVRVLRAALAGERRRRIGPLPLPPLPNRPVFFPRVYGLRLFPRSGGADELALDQALSEVSGAARAAYALRGLEGMTETGARRTLSEAGVRDADSALAEAAAVRGPAGSRDGSLLASPEFDACTLQARPTDLVRRRQHSRAALVALIALLVCGGLLGVPGGSWGPEGAAAPVYARNPSSEKALDPGELRRVAPGAWKGASRADFSAWPARGDLTEDHALLRRALAVWARPGKLVTVSATRGTLAGPPAGPPQLLYAGRVDGSKIVLLHDGMRIVRYAEPEGAEEGGAVLDLARADGADTAAAGALVVSRTDSDIRYLTAPWVARAEEADLLRPEDRGTPLGREEDGVVAAVTGPGDDPRDCTRWPGLLLTTRSASGGAAPHLYTDLGELTAVRLTDGAPGGRSRDATSRAARTSLARGVCGLRSMWGSGVRSVNHWEFGRQSLPEGEGVASWSCVRGETWRGVGARVIGGFRPPSGKTSESVVVTARAEGTLACGPREPHAVSGVLWNSQTGNRYLLAAGSEQVAGIRARSADGAGGVSAGRTLMLPVKKGPKAKLSARLANGKLLREPH